MTDYFKTSLAKIFNSFDSGNADGKIDAEWSREGEFEAFLLWGLAQDGLAGEMVKKELANNQKDFSAKDLEEILVAIYKFKCYYEAQNK